MLITDLAGIRAARSQVAIQTTRTGAGGKRGRYPDQDVGKIRVLTWLDTGKRNRKTSPRLADGRTRASSAVATGMHATGAGRDLEWDRRRARA
jgi:hypothetical protein